MIAYQGSLTFWTAAFPGLARELPETQESAKKAHIEEKTWAYGYLISVKLFLTRSASSAEEHAQYESLQRNRISNVSFAVASAGEVLILVVMVGILKGLKSDQSTENNTKAFSVLIAFAGGVWGESYFRRVYLNWAK